jgi:hypothetical protein
MTNGKEEQKDQAPVMARMKLLAPTGEVDDVG